LDAVVSLPLLSKPELSQALTLTLQAQNFLVTYHPETLGHISSQDAFAALLEALAHFEATTIIFTEANADPDGRIINQMIHQFCEKNPHAKSFQALGQKRYLSLLKQVDVMIGNSSSGIIEAAYYQVPTVNIGGRQTGRIKPRSVLDCQPIAKDIRQTIAEVLSPGFRQKIETMPLPYGEGKVAHKIVDVIRNTDLLQILKKPFYDIAIDNGVINGQ
jgi:UDP-hydrolysing UDP-N-acetyl-D-glucosamine 2-epimerase